MDTLFFAFANQQSDLLPTLQEEDDALSRLLSPRAKEQHFLLHRDSFVTLEKLPSALTLYRDELVVFLFSGHADRDGLLLGDGEAHSAGIAQMLGQCKRLKLVFLNGCSTQGQVSALLREGVPAVIATSAPVSDRKATDFSIRFFEALEQQFSIQEAFDMAKGALAMSAPNVRVEHHRGMGFETENGEKEPVWGLFSAEDGEIALDWTLPSRASAASEKSDFTPNQFLIDTLFKSLGAFNSDIQKLHQQIKNGVQVGLPKKRMAVLNALPAPLAEPLRKLMVPVEDENEGYDKVSEARLRQIVQAYNTSMELLCFTMLAQLWEAHDKGQLTIAPAQRETLRAFFRLSKTDREVYDLIGLVKALKEIFDQNKVVYFVQELGDISQLMKTDATFVESLRFLNGLRLQARQNTLDRSAVGYLSKRGEDSLAYLYSKLGFMARYRLATIQGIDVEQYRHRRKPSYNHATVMLHDLLGGFDLSQVNLQKPLDNRSILLVNEETWDYLNLSPFVVDENAFHERTEMCKLFFFSHFLQAADTWCFRYVNKPDDPLLEVSDEKYPLVKEQFESFAEHLLQQPAQRP